MTVTLYTTHGEPFTVDDEDAPLVQRFSWGKPNFHKPSHLVTCVSPPGCAAGPLPLHLMIMGSPPMPGLVAHNINRDRLCMEKSNLAWLDASTLRHRTCRPRDPSGHSEFRGVTRANGPRNKFKPWKLSGMPGYRGPRAFATEVEAAQAYDVVARDRYGPWARVNFPRPDDPQPLGLGFPLNQTTLRGVDGTLLKVDPEGLPLLSRHLWNPGPDGYETFIGWLRMPLAYLILGGPGVGGNPRLKWQDGDVCNCTRDNLSWRYWSVSTFRGVKPAVSGWLAKITVNKGRLYRLGIYDTPEEAARAYDKAARELLGPKARLNFPQEHGQP